VAGSVKSGRSDLRVNEYTHSLRCRMYGNWRDWYGLRRWRKQRAYHLQREPLCRLCAAEGRTVAAEVVDQVRHHEGIGMSFGLVNCSRCAAIATRAASASSSSAATTQRSMAGRSIRGVRFTDTGDSTLDFRRLSSAVATSREGQHPPRSGPEVQHRRPVLARETLVRSGA